tara:strand:- start:2053 stop:2571 length:519 start_codon:yes stop_codon:yes gene_type:complete
MKKLLIIKIIFFIITISPSVAINTSFIDMEKIFLSSEVGKDANNKVKILQKKKFEKIQKIEKTLKAKENKLNRQKNIITKDEFNKSLQLLKKDINDFNKMKNQEIKDFENKKAQYKVQLLNFIRPILATYAKAENISILLEKTNILLGVNELDITNNIIKILNKEATEITLK